KTLGLSNRTVSRCRQRLEKAGEVLPRLKSTQGMVPCPNGLCTSLIRPCPENDKIYEGEPDDAFFALAESIRVHGLQHPIIVSRDGFIISGHRRFWACSLFLKWKKIPATIRADFSYAGDRDRFLKLLTSCNTQRSKTTAEKLREGIVMMSTEDAG